MYLPQLFAESRPKELHRIIREPISHQKVLRHWLSNRRRTTAVTRQTQLHMCWKQRLAEDDR